MMSAIRSLARPSAHSDRARRLTVASAFMTPLVIFAMTLSASAAHAEVSGGGDGLSPSLPPIVNKAHSDGASLVLPSDDGHADIDAAQYASAHVKDSEPKKTVTQDISLVSESARKIIDSLKFCASSHDKDTRMGCYDDISRSYGIPIADASGGKIVETGAWSVKNDEKTDDYIAMLQSSIGVSVNGSEGHVDLYVRCRQKNLSIYMKYGVNIGEADVAVSIGDDALNTGRSYQFHPSKSGDAFGIWNTQQAHVMYDFLSGFGALLPMSFNVEGHTYRFNANLSRMREDTAQVRMACHTRSN